MALLEIEDLSVSFATARGHLRAVDGMSFSIEAGEVLGIVGESGSGKSVSMLALMGLVAEPGTVTARKLRFDGHDLLKMSARERRRLVGKDVAMIFQEPMTSLNPCFTVGYQIIEAIETHAGTRGATGGITPSSCSNRSAFLRPKAGSTPIRINFPAA